MRAFIITLIFISVIYSTTTYAQQRDVELTGMVTDHQGEPLPGVTIRVRNTQFGTVTDTDGRYLLRGRWKDGENSTGRERRSLNGTTCIHNKRAYRTGAVWGLFQKNGFFCYKNG